MLLSEEGTEQKDMTAASELTDHNKFKFLSKGYAGECEKDPTREPSFGTSSTKGLQLTSACTCNRLSSVGRSTRKCVSQTCKFFPIANNNHLAFATHRYRPSVINSEAIVFSSTTDQSKGRENQSVSDELKPVKADRVSPGAPVDSSRKPMDTKAGVTDEKSTHVTSVPPVYKGKMSYRASPALINYQVKAVNPKFKPQNPSNQAFSTNVFPQQMVTTTCRSCTMSKLSPGTTICQVTDVCHCQCQLQGYMAGLIFVATEESLRRKVPLSFSTGRKMKYMHVGSRESLLQDGYHYIVNELLRKYWIF